MKKFWIDVRVVDRRKDCVEKVVRAALGHAFRARIASIAHHFASEESKFVLTTIALEFDDSLHSFEDFVAALVQEFKPMGISVQDWSDDDDGAPATGVWQEFLKLLREIGLQH